MWCQLMASDVVANVSVTPQVLYQWILRYIVSSDEFKWIDHN